MDSNASPAKSPTTCRGLATHRSPCASARSRSALIFASANAQIVSDRVRPAEVSDCGSCGNHRSGGSGPYCLTNFCTTPLSCAR
jgi:hypothetical protein